LGNIKVVFLIMINSIISLKAKISNSAKIGNFCTINDNVVIGDNCIIEDYVSLGVSNSDKHDPLIIKENSKIRAYSLFYSGSEFGPNLVTGHRVMVREGIQAGRDLQLGTMADLEGEAKIGDYVRIHCSSHISQLSIIENFCWIYPYVVLTNDPTPPSDIRKGCLIKEFAIIATHACLLPGVTIGSNALVAAAALVSKNVPDNKIVAGVPAKVVGDVSSIKLQNSQKSAYPWKNHFSRGYPKELINEWKKQGK